jgi:hypothetical protein
MTNIIFYPFQPESMLSFLPLKWAPNCNILLFKTIDIILDSVHHPSLLKALCFRNWFFFWPQSTGYERKPTVGLLGRATLKTISKM